MTTRRGATRGHSRLASSSISMSADELSALREEAEQDGDEESLRRVISTLDKDNNRLRDQILSLQTMLAQRPPAEEVRAAKETVRNVELLLSGANKENERAMMDLDRANRRIQMLELELTRLAGDNWQTNLNIAPAPGSPTRASRPSISADGDNSVNQSGAAPPVTQAYLEQMRLLIIGMETHLQAREEELAKIISTAEVKEKHFQTLRKADA